MARPGAKNAKQAADNAGALGGAAGTGGARQGTCPLLQCSPCAAASAEIKDPTPAFQYRLYLVAARGAERGGALSASRRGRRTRGSTTARFEKEREGCGKERERDCGFSGFAVRFGGGGKESTGSLSAVVVAMWSK
eukprot:144206-Rhodomonas_salina.1